MWSPWKLWLANVGCFLSARVTRCLLRWALKLAVGVLTHNFYSEKREEAGKLHYSEDYFTHFALGKDVFLSLCCLFRHQIHPEVYVNIELQS